MKIAKPNNNHVPVLISSVVGIILTCLLAAFIANNENELAEHDFINTAKKLSDEISSHITSSTRAIYHLSSYYQGSEHITHEEFNLYVGGFINQYPEIHAFEWIPRIPHSLRNKHEIQQAIYKQGYTITQKHNDKGMIPATKRDYYFPVTYIFPMKGNESAFGYDLASDPVRKSMLEQSVLTSDITLSHAINLVQEKDNSNAVLIAIPITKTGKVSQSLNNDYLLGFIIGVFRINPILHHIIEYDDFKQLDIDISEFSNNTEQASFYQRYTPKQSKQLYHYSSIINIANVKWKINIKGDPDLYHAYTLLDYLIIFGIGLGFTTLLSAYIHLVCRNQKRAYKTSELLSLEINKRVRYEKKLLQSNNKLEALSREDPVMKIANRRAFNEYLMKEWKRAKRSGSPISLIIADVDNFKAYNDKYGHVVGDHCLRNIAEAFRKVAIRSSDLAARYGGEEIAVIMPETFEDGAATVAGNIHQAVTDLCIPHENSSTRSIVTISLGVTTIRNVDDYSIDQIIKLADAALYDG